MVIADGQPVILVLRAPDTVDEGRLAGALPPFGHLYGLPVCVDARLAEDETIHFNGGAHTYTSAWHTAISRDWCSRGW